MTTTIKKAFLGTNEEEKWLNKQGEQDMMLLSYNNGVYEFEDVSPAAFQYKIDIIHYPQKEKKRDYLDFLEQTGISVVAEYADRVYLRKKTTDKPFELYTSWEDIEREVKVRWSRFFAIGFPQIMFGAMLLIQGILKHESPVSFWIPVVFGILFVISGIIFLVLGYRADKKTAKGQSASREEQTI